MDRINHRRPEAALGRSFILLAVIVIFLTSWAEAQTSFNVVDVRVTGNRIAKESLIKSVAGIKKGDQLTATTTQDAVSRLYHLGFFRNITILAEESIGGLILTIEVKELPKLGTLSFSGNDHIKDKVLTEKLDLTQNNYLSDNLIWEKRNEIVDVYGKKGYFFARVDYELKYNEDSSSADLKYKIKEGSKIKVENVVLTGNRQVEAKKIIGKMRNRKRGFLRTSNFDKEKFSEDKEKIIDYLHNEGHIDAYLKSDSISIDTASNRMTIYLDIYEGPRYYFGNTEFTGNEVIEDRILKKVLKYKEGEVFDFEEFDESLYEIYFLYQEKGHLHIRVIDDRKTRDSLIDITFDVVEGLPSEVNLVKIVGNTRTKEKVIRREMKIRPGQVFHRSLLLRSIRDIMALNYFGNVTPDILDLPTGDVDLVINVEEKPTAQVSAGAGYSGRDKFVGTFGLGIPNFRGLGQYLGINVDVGSRRNSYTLSFTEPWAFSTPTTVGFDLYYTNRDWYSDYTEGRRGGSIRLGRRLRWPDNYSSAFVRYRLEEDRFHNFSDLYIRRNSYRTFYDISIDTLLNDTAATLKYNWTIIGDPLPNSLLRFNEEWFSSSSLQFTYIRDSRDLPEFSTRGSKLTYSFETTGGFLGGYWKYQKHVLSYSHFIPLFWKVALGAKVTFGAINAPSGDNRILEFDRFSPGGTGFSGVVRGYDDGSLTPDSIATFIDTTYIFDEWPDSTASNYYDSSIDTLTYVTNVRGKYMLVGNFELQLPLLENQLYALAFYDIGNSWLNGKDVNFKDLYSGIGVGLRLVVPGVGTIGFDFGNALDAHRNPRGEKDQEGGWKFHFQIGTVFR